MAKRPRRFPHSSTFSPKAALGTKMSEEKGVSLRFKGIQRKSIMKHSTPVEVSTTLSRNRLAPSSSAFLSPVPKKSFKPTQPFEDGPQLTKAWGSWGLHQIKQSMGSLLGSDTTNSSQFMFPRRQLSTITGSEDSSVSPGLAIVTSKRTRGSSALLTATRGPEESSEAPDQADIPSEVPSKRTRGSSELPSKHWEVATRWASALRNSSAKRKGKQDKKLVKNRTRAWVLRQLKNIEEATTHELTIEEV